MVKFLPLLAISLYNSSLLLYASIFSAISLTELYIEKFPYDKDVLTSAYIKEMDEPVVINQFGRIRYEHDDDD